jgi:hypothetical protein
VFTLSWMWRCVARVTVLLRGTRCVHFLLDVALCGSRYRFVEGNTLCSLCPGCGAVWRGASSYRFVEGNTLSYFLLDVALCDVVARVTVLLRGTRCLHFLFLEMDS